MKVFFHSYHGRSLVHQKEPNGKHVHFVRTELKLKLINYIIAISTERS